MGLRHLSMRDVDYGSVGSSGRSPGEAHGNPLQYSCLENPQGQEPGGLQSTRSHRVRHNWSHLGCTHRHRLRLLQDSNGDTPSLSFPCEHQPYPRSWIYNKPPAQVQSVSVPNAGAHQSLWVHENPEVEEEGRTRTSLVVHWLRTYLPMQGTWVDLVWEDPTRLGATKPESYNYWAHIP